MSDSQLAVVPSESPTTLDLIKGVLQSGMTATTVDVVERLCALKEREDKREAARLDFEWSLGDHLLRFGLDQEVMDSNSAVRYPNDGISYQVQAANAGSPLNGTVIPAGTTAIVDARRYITGTPVTTEAQAIYIEDNWSVTPNLLLNLGLRADKFHNKYASGVTFAKADFSDMIAPRVGWSQRISAS